MRTIQNSPHTSRKPLLAIPSLHCSFKTIQLSTIPFSKFEFICKDLFSKNWFRVIFSNMLSAYYFICTREDLLGYKEYRDR